ncbi:sugar ABC transporter ATP-binding protein, partial [Aliirhizobium smilacinae]
GQMTARASGEFGARHGDTVYLTPDETRLHRFDDKGLAIKA